MDKERKMETNIDSHGKINNMREKGKIKELLVFVYILFRRNLAMLKNSAERQWLHIQEQEKEKGLSKVYGC